jgi:predicted HicB family RNase H-like nuclease
MIAKTKKVKTQKVPSVTSTTKDVKQVNIRVPREMWKAWSKMAIDSGESFQALVIRIVEEYRQSRPRSGK